jgi:hypothetical protein
MTTPKFISADGSLAIETGRLNRHGNYALVLAERSPVGALKIVSYSNLTQAHQRVSYLTEFGIACHVWEYSSPFYIFIDEVQSAAKEVSAAEFPPIKISTAMAVRMMKAELKAAFPDVDFTFRRPNGIVCVSWVDGPLSDKVDAFISKYERRGFDGMNDYAYFMNHGLTPDGTIVNLGSHESGAPYYIPKPVELPEGAIRANVRVEYAHTDRNFSRAALTYITEQLADAQNATIEGEDDNAYLVSDDHTIRSIPRRLEFDKNAEVVSWN